MKYKFALVTGATSGLGKAIAMKLAEKKIPLIITGRKQYQLSALAMYLRHQVNVIFFPSELSCRVDRQKILSHIYEYAPDLVVNAAGFGLYGNALMHPTAQQMKILKVNGNALLELSLEAARTLVGKRKKGTICNISSVSGFLSSPSMAVYAASKAFVTLFSQSFDAEMRSYGIRILASCPGQVDTDFARRASGKPFQQQNWTISKEYAADRILNQIEKQKSLDIFDWRYRSMLFLRHFIPQSFVEKKIQSAIDQRHDWKEILPVIQE